MIRLTSLILTLNGSRRARAWKRRVYAREIIGFACHLLWELLCLRTATFLFSRGKCGSFILRSSFVLFKLMNLLFQLNILISDLVIFTSQFGIFLSQFVGHIQLLILHFFESEQFFLVFFMFLLRLLIQIFDCPLLLFNNLFQISHLVMEGFIFSLGCRCRI